MRPSANPQGNPRESSLPAPTPPENVLAPPEAPEPPEHLNESGRAFWADLWALGQGSYNPQTDRYTVERYASLQQRRHELMAVLDAEGYLTVGSQGQTVAHPAARLLSDIESKLLPLEDRLGLSPESRIRLGIGALEHKSKLDMFLDDSNSGTVTNE